MQKLKEQFRRPVRAVRAGMARRSVGRLRTSSVNGRETLVRPEDGDASELIDLVALERGADAKVDEDVSQDASAEVSPR